MSSRSTVRRIAAARLRRLADRIDRRRPGRAKPGPAPLIRMGGLWWQRDDAGLLEVLEPDA